MKCLALLAALLALSACADRSERHTPAFSFVELATPGSIGT